MNIYLKLSLSTNFEKMKLGLFRRGKIEIIFSWLWAEIISVVGVSTGVDIVIIIMNTGVFWVDISGFLLILLVRKWRILVKWFYLEINCGWYIRFFMCVFRLQLIFLHH